jgi:hypothetical protein
MGRVAKALAVIWLGMLLVLTSGSVAQRRVSNYPKPPEPSMPDDQDPLKRQPSQPKADFLEMERESKELSQIASSIPGDVDQLRKGLLPKDVTEKLKRIEKLSKQLRSKITAQPFPSFDSPRK